MESDNTSNADVSVEAHKNGTGISGRVAEIQEEMLDSVRVAVVLEGFPESKMTEKQAEMLEAALVEKINQTDQGEPIQFSATQYTNGALVFTCANNTTKSWLYRNARKLVPWRGARLAVGHAETTVNGVRLVMWGVPEVSKRSNEQILDLLQKQNKDVFTAEWKIYSRDAVGDEKVRLILWVDNKSYAYLKERDFKLFLGLAQAKFMLTSEWYKLKSSLPKQQVPENLTPRSASYVSFRPRYPQQLTRNYTPNVPVSPWLVPPPVLSQNILIPSSGSSAVHQSWGLGLSNADSHDQLKFASTVALQFNKSQFTALDQLLPREHMESAILQNYNSRFLTSEKLSERAFGTLAESQSGEANLAILDLAQCKDRRYTSDRPQESRYFASESRQSLETVHGIPYPPPLLGTNYTASYRALSRDSTSVTANRDKSRDSRYVPPNRDQLENARFGGSGKPPSLVSRFSDLDKPLTESALLPSLVSPFLPSEQPHMRGFSVSEPPQSQEASFSVLDRAQRREPRYTSDRSEENKYRTSDSRQPLETVYRVPEPSQLRKTSHTALDWSTSHDSESVTANKDKSRYSRYVRPNRDLSDNTTFGGSDRLASRVSRFSDLDEPLRETATRHNLTSADLSSEQPRERGYEMSELQKSQLASYSASDRAQSKEARYTLDRHQDYKYSTSDRRQPLETVHGIPYPPPLLGTSYMASVWTVSHDSKSVTANRDRSGDSRHLSPNRDRFRDSRHVSPNRDVSDNIRFTDSDCPLSHVSGLSDLDEPLTESATLHNLTSTFLSSEQRRECGYETSEFPKSRKARYSVSDEAQTREARYSSHRHRDGKYSTSDRTPPHNSKSVIRNRDKFRSSPELTAKRDKSRDSKYVPPIREESENGRFRGSSFRHLDEPVTETAALQNLASMWLTSEQLRERGFGTSELPQLREASYSVSDRAQRSESRYTSERYRDDEYLFSGSRQPLKTVRNVSDLSLLHETRYTTSDRALSSDSKPVIVNRDRSRGSRYKSPNREQSETLRLRDSNRSMSRDSRFKNRDESPVWESRFRGSDKMQSREGRFEEREYSRESRSRLSDPQQYGDFDDTVPHTRSREDRISVSDISSERSRSPYRRSRHSRSSKSLDSRKTKW